MNCNDSCKPGFIPGPPAPNYASGCSLAENPTFKTYVLPASVGTDAPGQPYAPKIGEFRNAIVIYEANGNIYIYDSLGTPTLMEKGDYNGPGPLPSIPIVQETGTSTTSVMSQNAVTNELNNLSTEIAKTNNTIANLSGDVNNNTITITSLETKVQDLQESVSQVPNVVQSTGSSTTDVMSQDAVTNTINNAVTDLNARIDGIEGGGSVEVVQTTGQSTTAVMSQDATTKAINQVSTQVSGKQDTLVSGTNIKTINGEAVLGSGDITIGPIPGIITGTIQVLSLPPNATTIFEKTVQGSFFSSSATRVMAVFHSQHATQTTYKMPSLAIDTNVGNGSMTITAALTNSDTKTFINSAVDYAIITT